jgi:hypothetical protein
LDRLRPDGDICKFMDRQASQIVAIASIGGARRGDREQIIDGSAFWRPRKLADNGVGHSPVAPHSRPKLLAAESRRGDAHRANVAEPDVLRGDTA